MLPQAPFHAYWIWSKVNPRTNTDTKGVIVGAYVINKNRKLTSLLSHANNEELGRIADIITDNGDGRISLDKETCATIVRHRKHGGLTNITALLQSEICAFGGNSLFNIIRSSPIAYHEMVTDIAKKLGAKYQKESDTYAIELEVMRVLLEKALQKKTSSEIEALLQESGCEIDPRLDALIRSQSNIKLLTQSLMKAIGPYSFVRLLVEAMTPSLIRPVVAAAGVAIVPVLRVPALFNPLGIALSAIYVGYDLSGPAYRVTIPIMMNIAMIRQRIIASEKYRLMQEFRECL